MVRAKCDFNNALTTAKFANLVNISWNLTREIEILHWISLTYNAQVFQYIIYQITKVRILYVYANNRCDKKQFN